MQAQVQQPPVLFNPFADNLFRSIIRSLDKQLNDEDNARPQGNIEIKPQLVAGLPAYMFKASEGRQQAWVVYNHELMSMSLWLGSFIRPPMEAYEESRANKHPVQPDLDLNMFGHHYTALTWMIDETSEWILDYLFLGRLPEITADTYVRPEPELVGYVDENEIGDED